MIFPLTKVYKTSLSHSDWKNKWDLEMQWRRTVKRSSLWAETSAVCVRCRHSWKRQQQKVLGICTFNLWLSALEKCSFLTTNIFLQADIDSPSRDVRQLNNTYKHHLKIKKPTRLTNHPDRDCFKDPRSHSLTWLDRIYDSKSGLVALPLTPAFNTMLWPGAGAKTPWTVLLSDELCFLY